jgi:hypothetical protein
MGFLFFAYLPEVAYFAEIGRLFGLKMAGCSGKPACLR